MSRHANINRINRAWRLLIIDPDIPIHWNRPLVGVDHLTGTTLEQRVAIEATRV